VNIRLATIGDFVDSVTNWNPATKPHEQFTYLDLSSVSQAEKRIAAANVVSGAHAPSRARQIVKTGDILVSTVRPNLNGVAPVTEEFDGATASTGFCILRPRSEKLYSNYLMHWVRSPDFIKSMVGQAAGCRREVGWNLRWRSLRVLQPERVQR
jgi:type I restriction enzyme S subunit